MPRVRGQRIQQRQQQADGHHDHQQVRQFHHIIPDDFAGGQMQILQRVQRREQVERHPKNQEAAEAESQRRQQLAQQIAVQQAHSAQPTLAPAAVASFVCRHQAIGLPLARIPTIVTARTMPTLLEKMEANAAERLALPPGRRPTEELARYKNFLKVETHRLKILHRSGKSGREICQARAALMDILLRSLWDAAVNSLTPQARKEFPPLALVAIGGYGRAELNPHSDIDFMFLHDGRLVSSNRPLPQLARIIDGMLYPLWDIGLKVGYSVRSVAECVDVANTDMQSKTSIIEARLITATSRCRQISKSRRRQMRGRARGRIYRRAAGGSGQPPRQVRQFRLYAGAEY